MAGENSGLNGSAERDDFVGIEFGVGLLAARREMEEVIDQAAHRGDARRSADEDDLVNLFWRDAGIGQGLLAGTGSARENWFDQLLEDFARNVALIAVAVPALSTASWLSKGLGFGALVLASVNIFGGFLVTARMLAMYKKKEK